MWKDYAHVPEVKRIVYDIYMALCCFEYPPLQEQGLDYSSLIITLLFSLE